MAEWLKYVIVALAGYLLGNISVGILISKAYGVKDIRKLGSGNAGSTNVLRTLGWLPSLITLVGDCGKGLLAAELGRLLLGDIGMLVGGMLAIIGHDFPVIFRFRGGKGIATTLGLIIAINPWIALILLAQVLLTAGFTGYVSVGSLIASALFPALTALFMRGNAHYAAYLLVSVLAGLLAIFCHRRNISRLIRHEENKLDFKRIRWITSKLNRTRK